jgi:hypothetical protein
VKLTLSLLSLIFALLAPPASAVPYAPSQLIRLYDMTPASEANPVLARVESCGIEIPLSEFQKYVLTEGPMGGPQTVLNDAEKRALLERLVDEHLFLWDAYRKNYDALPSVRETLESTRDMMLLDTLMSKEIIEPSKSLAEQRQRHEALVNRAFDRLHVDVSNENYEALKAELKRRERSSAPAPADVLDLPLAKWDRLTLSIKDVLARHESLPAEKRPDLRQPEGLIEVLKKILEEPALAEEARAQKLHETPEFRDRFQLNRNTLTRFHAQDRRTDRCAAHLKTPAGQSALRAWYERNLQSRYTIKDKEGKERVISLETDYQSIENDFFDVLQEDLRSHEARALRAERKIVIEEQSLARAEVRLALPETGESLLGSAP